MLCVRILASIYTSVVYHIAPRTTNFQQQCTSTHLQRLYSVKASLRRTMDVEVVSFIASVKIPDCIHHLKLMPALQVLVVDSLHATDSLLCYLLFTYLIYFIYCHYCYLLLIPHGRFTAGQGPRKIQRSL
jgi:hypothetical protein